ncbi:MAG: hypothetical protein HYY93_10420, partial [Planctomycetes bacterium]|nr:hypothetical protein [Planctomycetota bacterium]
IGGTRSIGTPTADADGSLDINGNVVINSSASFAPGAYTHTVGGSWDDSIATGGFVPAAGTIRFDSTTAGTLAIRQRTAATRNKFFNVEFAGGAGTVYQLTRVVTNAQYNPGTPFLADGSLTVSGGALDLNTPAVNNYVTVAGSVIVSPGATLDAGGMTATLRVGGDWTTNGTYTPGSVTVGFNGGVQTISTATGSDVFSSIDIGIDGAGPSVTIQGSLTVSTAVAGGFVTAGTLDVDVGATLNLAGATTYNVSPGALLQLHGDSTLALISGATLDMNFPGGTLKTSGTSPVSRATLTRSGAAGTWSLVVNGDIDIQHYRVMYLAATGLQIGAGCNVITLDSGEYDFPAVGGTLLNFDSYGSGPALSIGGCRFENSLGVSGVSNVRGIPLNPALGVTMYGWGGALGGAEYEDDSANLIGWTSDVFVRITGAGEAAFGTLQAALNAATGAGDVVESRGSSYVDLGTGAAIFPDVSGVILRNTFILNGSIQGSGGVPGNRGILRNCFVQFNGGTQNIGGTNPLDFVQNCTVVDTTGTAGTKITADSVENTILTGGAGMTISATVEFTNSIGAASSNVVDAFRGDYHHESTSIGIDVGTDLNAVHGVHAAHGFSDDIDGNPRPMGAGWDLGADEFGPGTPNAAPAWTTAEVAGGLFGKLLAPADFNFNTARLYAGTASGGASNNNSLLRINPTTGAVDYTLDLVAALDLADDGLPNASTTSAEVVTTPVMFRTADGSDGDALPDDVILVSVDTDPTPDGSGDRLAAVQDTGAALVLYVDFSGNGVLDSLDLAADRIFEPVGQPIWDSNAGVITLYIPCSTTAVSGSTALSKYNVAGLRAWAYPTRFPDRRVPVFYNRGISRCFFGITGDTIDGSDAVSVDTAGVASWAQIMGGAVVNRRPLIWISPGSSASWAMGAPEGQNAFAIEGSTGNPKWTSPDLNGTPTSQTINPFGYAWGYVGIGEHIAKFNRQTGALAADADEIGEDWATDDWLRGRISGNLLSFGGWMYCGTERGYCYRLTALNSETGSNDGRNGVVAGFPYRVPGTRIMGGSVS